ncbi:hypothetical protein Taro_036735 [Colocasia esculenta]|uniref:Uncharacterized protein n=1 Tax=Colocasia esculenta TaxID=4460 RepID=A0A843WAP1_COLES|nr:hypothetical protein [Colocasia esculenta]
MTVRQQTLATASPYLKRVGGDYQSLTSQSSRNSNKSGSKLLYKTVKRETPTVEYYKVAEIEKRLDHNPEPAESNTMRKQTPRHTPTETKELMEHRSNHVRPECHDISTNIPDLHEVGKEQPGVTSRDTKQPSENERLTTGMATSDLHKVKGPQVEPPLHLEHATRSGNYTLQCHQGRHQGMGYKNNSWVPAQGTPREPVERKPLNTAHEAKPTKPTEVDTARLQPPCRLG